MNKKNIKNTKFTSEKGSTADYYDENGFHWDSYNDYLEQTNNVIYDDDYVEPLDRKHYTKYDERNIFPIEVKREDVSTEIVNREFEIAKELSKEAKTAEIAEKMAKGKLEKFFKEKVLLEQPFIFDEKKSVLDYGKERIQITRPV